MRTTIAIDDDVLEQAKAIARARRISLGKAVTYLMRRGFDLQIGDRDGFPVLRVPPDAHPITSDAIKAAEDEW